MGARDNAMARRRPLAPPSRAIVRAGGGIVAVPGHSIAQLGATEGSSVNSGAA